MKSFYYFTLIPLLASCTQEATQQNAGNDISNAAIFSREYDDNFANPQNPYDNAGRLYFDITDAYVMNMPAADLSGEITFEVQSIADSNIDYSALKGIGYTAPSAKEISLLLAGDAWTLDQTIAGLNVNDASKLELSNLTSKITEYDAKNYALDSIYHFVIDFEKSITANAKIPVDDKKMILTTSSLLRYAYHFKEMQKQKPRDRNWDVTMCCLIAAVSGSAEEPAKGIVTLAVTSILSNNI